MKSLASLHLEDLPYLNGTLPACLGNISRLGSITIEQTGLQGEIPWSRWMPLFKDQGSILNSLGLRFSLKGNLGLYGRALPEEFPLGCLIQNFRISQQPRLSGDLPSTVSKCRMKTLYITDVSLTGELPLEICEICTLEYLIISGTNLSIESIDAFNSSCTITQHIDLCISKGKKADLPQGLNYLKYTWKVSR